MALHLDSVDSSRFDAAPCQPHLSFHKLERLTLGDMRCVTSSRYVVNPTCMPKLKHLAIARDQVDYLHLVSAVLPQIVTLAIGRSPSNVSLTSSALMETLPLLVKLEHLSLAEYTNAIPQLFGRPQSSQLESLHLGSRTLEHHLEVTSKLVDLVKQQQAEHKTGRIVLYGSKPKLVKRIRLTTELDLLEWRQKIHSAPFEYFDGQ